MARAIDADEAILQIERREKHLVGDLFISVDAMKEFIKNRPTIEPKQEWISVKDRLPPDGNKPYLTCRKTVKGRTVIESRYLHTSYESPCVAYWEGKKNGEVTHWMPLPEPPKKGE